MRIDLAGNWYRDVIIGDGFITHPDPKFKVRKSQLGKDIVVGYRNESPYDCYVLKKSDKNTYTIETTYKKGSHFGNMLIRKFVDGKIDFYYLDGKIYNENNEEEDNIIDLNYRWLFVEANNVCIIKDNIYLLYRYKKFLTILNYQPKVTFVVDKSIQRMFRSKGIDAYVFEDSLLKFRVNKYFVKKLAKLETVEEMKELILRELTMNVI